MTNIQLKTSLVVTLALKSFAVWTHDVIFTTVGRHLIAGNPDGTVSVLRLAEVGQLLK